MSFLTSIKGPPLKITFSYMDVDVFVIFLFTFTFYKTISKLYLIYQIDLLLDFPELPIRNIGMGGFFCTKEVITGGDVGLSACQNCPSLPHLFSDNVWKLSWVFLVMQDMRLEIDKSINVKAWPLTSSITLIVWNFMLISEIIGKFKMLFFMLSFGVLKRFNSKPDDICI